MAKYESSAGVLILAWNQARYGVSHRTSGRSFWRIAYRHGGSFRLSMAASQLLCVRIQCTLAPGVLEGQA